MLRFTRRCTRLQLPGADNPGNGSWSAFSSAQTSTFPLTQPSYLTHPKVVSDMSPGRRLHLPAPSAGLETCSLQMCCRSSSSTLGTCALLFPQLLQHSCAHLLPIQCYLNTTSLLFMFYCKKLGHCFLQLTLAYSEVFHSSLFQRSLLLVCVLFAAGLCLSAGLGYANDQQIQ